MGGGDGRRERRGRREPSMKARGKGVFGGERTERISWGENGF
jgi:hypothetical protein